MTTAAAPPEAYIGNTGGWPDSHRAAILERREVYEGVLGLAVAFKANYDAYTPTDVGGDAMPTVGSPVPPLKSTVFRVGTVASGFVGLDTWYFDLARATVVKEEPASVAKLVDVWLGHLVTVDDVLDESTPRMLELKGPEDTDGQTQGAARSCSVDLRLPNPYLKDDYKIRLTYDADGTVVATFDGQELVPPAEARLGLARRAVVEARIREQDTLGAKLADDRVAMIKAEGVDSLEELVERYDQLHRIIGKVTRLRDVRDRFNRAGDALERVEVHNLAIALLAKASDEQLSNAFENPTDAVNPNTPYNEAETWYINNAVNEELGPPAPGGRTDAKRVEAVKAKARAECRKPEVRKQMWLDYASWVRERKALHEARQLIETAKD
ncbi:MAG TPA: hypothetical protein VLH84_04905 [Patescibacteria group bacterium]|nr:hypothetical protein [Patescibacteria group bacterium]